MSELALPDTHWDLSGVGLKITDPSLSYAEFEHLCGVLGALHEAVRFAIGDAIIQGEHLYGEKAYAAFELFNLSEAGRLEYVRVAQRVPRSRRRRDLSWSHHRAVAALDPVEQKSWLKKASDEALSHHDLRAALRNGADPSRNVEVCPTCGKRLG